MWTLLIEVADPQIEIGLQLVDRTIHLFAERDTIELVERGLVEAFTDAVRLRALGRSRSAHNRTIAFDLRASASQDSGSATCVYRKLDSARREAETR